MPVKFLDAHLIVPVLGEISLASIKGFLGVLIALVTLLYMILRAIRE